MASQRRRANLDTAAVGSEPAEVILQGVALFNRGEYEAALDILGPGIEWDTTGAVPDGTAYRGREEVLAYWRSIPDRWADFRIEPERTVQGDGLILLLGRLYGRGVDSGVPVETTWDQVWRIEDERPVRCENYIDRARAWRTAGLEPDS
jgi:ketosteroid isomerase-like protein